MMACLASVFALHKSNISQNHSDCLKTALDLNSHQSFPQPNEARREKGGYPRPRCGTLSPVTMTDWNKLKKAKGNRSAEYNLLRPDDRIRA